MRRYQRYKRYARYDGKSPTVVARIKEHVNVQQQSVEPIVVKEYVEPVQEIETTPDIENAQITIQDEQSSTVNRQYDNSYE